MIIKFNPEVFETKDDKSLAAIFELFFSYFNDAFLWDIDNLETIFLTEEGEFLFNNQFRADYLAPKHFEKLEDKIYEAFERAAYNTQNHKKYLRAITIGNSVDEIPPTTALKLISKPSYIVVENKFNDGRFMEGLIRNYAGFGKRGSIYTLIQEAFDNGRLVFINAGGGGGLKVTSEQLNTDNFSGRGRFKVFILFDSDRNNSTSINTKYNNLLTFVKGRPFNHLNVTEWVYSSNDMYIWHMTYKREMENYVPLALMYQTFPEILINLQQQINGETSEYKDFYDFDTILNDGYKNISPGIFLNKGLVPSLEEKCSHHAVQIELPNGTLTNASEIEDILLKIALII